MLVNKMFVDLIGKTIEVYVDNMFMKCLTIKDLVNHIGETFKILRTYMRKLNPLSAYLVSPSKKF